MNEEEKVVKTSSKKTTKKVPAKKTTTKSVKETKDKVVKETKKETVKKVATTKTSKTNAKATKTTKVASEAKKAPAKKTTTTKTKEKTPAKKATTKKTTVKKVEPKVVEKKIEVEDEKVINATVDQELIQARAKRQIIETIILLGLFVILLLLLFNKSFIKTSYTNDNMSINIPRFMYYVGDNGSTVTFKTLRKSTNVREYFDETLEGFVYYDCSETGYYDEQTNTFIKSITVDKNWLGIKTVKIEYTTKVLSEICS